MFAFPQIIKSFNRLNNDGVAEIADEILVRKLCIHMSKQMAPDLFWRFLQGWLNLGSCLVGKLISLFKLKFIIIVLYIYIFALLDETKT